MVLVKFYEVYIFSQNMESSFNFARIPDSARLEAKVFQNVVLKHKNASKHESTLATVSSKTGNGQTHQGKLAARLVLDPFPFFFVVSARTQASPNDITSTMTAFIVNVTHEFDKLDPDVQQMMKNFGKYTADPSKEDQIFLEFFGPILNDYLELHSSETSLSQ